MIGSENIYLRQPESALDPTNFVYSQDLAQRMHKRFSVGKRGLPKGEIFAEADDNFLPSALSSILPTSQQLSSLNPMLYCPFNWHNVALGYYYRPAII